VTEHLPPATPAPRNTIVDICLRFNVRVYGEVGVRVRRLSPCSCCCDSQASIRLETTSRKTQPHVAHSHSIGSQTTEHRSFLVFMEESSLENTGVRYWTRLHSRRACHEEREGGSFRERVCPGYECPTFGTKVRGWHRWCALVVRLDIGTCTVKVKQANERAQQQAVGGGGLSYSKGLFTAYELN